MNLRQTLAGTAALTACVSAFADIKINDSLSTSGYIVGSYQYTKPSGDSAPESTDRFDLDAAKLLFSANLKQATGVISFYHVPGAPDSVTVLDAYATYNAGNGITVTGGKFLSYLGYEAFDIPNMAQISYANGKFLGVIPGYHTGVKFDFSDEVQGVGLALVDSVYSGSYYLRGDGELKHNGGFEGYYTYKGIKDLTLWAGFGYDTKGNTIHKNDAIVALDFWLSYQLTPAASVGAEYAHKDGGPGDTGYNWLAFFGYNHTEKFSTAYRISGEEMEDDGPKFTKFTFAPSYKLTENLIVRAEYSYTDYTRYAGANSENFFGVQGIFKF